MTAKVAEIIILIVCTRHYVLAMPGDNSHYEEGKSRYIWMSDGEGKLTLVDLHEPADENLLRDNYGTNNSYWLYTRRNPNNPQIIVHGNVYTIRYSNYVYSLPLKVIVHGWLNNGNTAMNSLIRSAFLAVQNCNVIVVDWHGLANQNYMTAVAGVPSVGQYLGKFLKWLLNTAGGNWNAVHLVGFSLGAHVVGNAGRVVGGRPGRIAGLDPAGPKWHSNSNALNRSNSQYVEVIHTDGHILGMFKPIGHADFYPNSGKNPQPGCFISPCSHRRSTELFASTIRLNHLIGRLCANESEAEMCFCNGAFLRMGNAMITKRGYGLFCLRTGSKWPY